MTLAPLLRVGIGLAVCCWPLVAQRAPLFKAGNWQIKEHVWYGARKVEIDLPRVRQIIDKVGYRGFTPIEALGEGDPKQVVTAFLTKVRQAFA